MITCKKNEENKKTRLQERQRERGERERETLVDITNRHFKKNGENKKKKYLMQIMLTLLARGDISFVVIY